MIEDRPLTEEELDAIVEATMLASKEPNVQKMENKISQLSVELKGIVLQSDYWLIEKISQLEYQRGFWNGKMFEEILEKNRKKRENS